MSAYDGIAGIPSDFWGSPVLRDNEGQLYCPGFIGATFSTSEWDYCTFGGDLSPGVCTVTIHKTQAVDVKKAAGVDNATQTFHGLNPGEIDISITLWTPQQFEELKKLWKKIMPRAEKTVGTAYDFYHPSTATMGIKSVAVIAGSFGADGKVSRSKVFSIRATEWYQPKKRKTSTKTPIASIGSVLDPGRVSNGQVVPRPLPGAAARNTGP